MKNSCRLRVYRLTLVVFVSLFILAPEVLALPAKTSVDRERRRGVSDDASSQNEVHFGLGIRGILPIGVGLECGVRFTPDFAIRVGGAYLSPTVKTSMPISSLRVPEHIRQPLVNSLGYEPKMTAEIGLKNIMGYVLLDYHPFSGFRAFRMTVGSYIGETSLYAHIGMINPKTGGPVLDDWKSMGGVPKIVIEDTVGNEYIIRPGEEGDFKLNMRLGHQIKPYIGLGLGSSVPEERRVSFCFDIGVLYSGTLDLQSPNVIQGDPNKLMALEKEHYPKVYRWTQWLPVVSLGCAVRLF